MRRAVNDSPKQISIGVQIVDRRDDKTGNSLNLYKNVVVNSASCLARVAAPAEGVLISPSVVGNDEGVVIDVEHRPRRATVVSANATASVQV